MTRDGASLTTQIHKHKRDVDRFSQTKQDVKNK